MVGGDNGHKCAGALGESRPSILSDKTFCPVNAPNIVNK